MKMMNLLSWKWINEEREIPGRQKVVRGSSVSTLTSHAGLNPRSCRERHSAFWLRLSAAKAAWLRA